VLLDRGFTDRMQRRFGSFPQLRPLAGGGVDIDFMLGSRFGCVFGRGFGAARHGARCYESCAR
jgi:hypothetical protein